MPQRFSTQAAYRTYLGRYIKPKWAQYSISTVKPFAVRAHSSRTCRTREVPRAAMFSQYHPRGSTCRDYSGLADRRLHRRGRPVTLRGDSLAKPFAAERRGNEGADDRCCEQDVPRTDCPVRRPARRRTDQDLGAARFFTSLERADLDHDGLRPNEPLTARIGATDGNHACCALGG